VASVDTHMALSLNKVKVVSFIAKAFGKLFYHVLALSFFATSDTFCVSSDTFFVVFEPVKVSLTTR
jgi:hypothetical protein